MTGRDSAVRIALLFPELLGTYGDGGNAVVLTQRLRWRGIDAELVRVPVVDPVPSSCDVYVLGGGEDAPQTFATERLADGGLQTAVDAGAVVFAVCAGFQILGRSFTGADGAQQPGLGVLDCSTRPKGSRQIGELVVQPTALDLPLLTGFENHGGITELGADATPLGFSLVGSGNGTGGVEGVVTGKVVGHVSPWAGAGRAIRRWPICCCHGSSAPSTRSTTRSSTSCVSSDLLRRSAPGGRHDRLELDVVLEALTAELATDA